MSVVVDVTHDIDGDSDKNSQYNIRQKENDGGSNRVFFRNRKKIKGVEHESWFLGMVRVIRDKARQQIFNAVLESAKIEDGLVKLE